MLHAVIMAGGSGTRFWPASTEAKPKQFLALFGEQTMLQATVERVKSFTPIERIWVVTNERYVKLTGKQLPGLPSKNIIGEPVGKNTAPCVGAAAAFIAREDANATMAVLPADHLIENDEAFRSVLEKAKDKARESEALGTIGIQPRHPETGYGYIEVEKENGPKSVKPRRVIRFCEKPDKATARKFIKAGNYLWNSGMFIWQISAIKSQFQKHLPDIFEQIEMLQKKAGIDSRQEAIRAFYRACPSVSIDYGIMEKAENVFVLVADFGWNDVGDWKAFYERSDKDEAGNAVQAEFTVLEDAGNNLIQTESDKIIALVGVDNIAVVETNRALLICDLDKAQKVKQAVNKIRNDKKLSRFL